MGVKEVLWKWKMLKSVEEVNRTVSLWISTGEIKQEVVEMFKHDESVLTVMELDLKSFLKNDQDITTEANLLRKKLSIAQFSALVQLEYTILKQMIDKVD